MEYNDEKIIEDEKTWQNLSNEYSKEFDEIELDEKVAQKLSNLFSNLDKSMLNHASFLGLKAVLDNHFKSIKFEIKPKFFKSPNSILSCEIFEILNIIINNYNRANDLQNKRKSMLLIKALIEIGIDINSAKRKW